ncbi:hypothetical protein MTQ01_21525 [Streptomyces sp. XM4193]|uniref:hypothetical protein n=1 Tax=Streptomyces sp. XM4193 TaxID=2929782 RepID=UPI001FF98923|nr:hypothetical protein [Streptomyces sp. XM4193]MCK1798558.1 hypothetical protein [Streptomyces sp. XM4193]
MGREAVLEETVQRYLWASPVCFTVAAAMCFALGPPSGDGHGVGWSLYAAGWLLPLVALVWRVGRGGYPGAGAKFAFGLLLTAGVLFALTGG